MIGCRFSSLHSWTSIEYAYCGSFMFISLNVFLIVVIGILSFVPKYFINGICVVAFAPATRTISGATFHPLYAMLLTSD